KNHDLTKAGTKPSLIVNSSLAERFSFTRRLFTRSATFGNCVVFVKPCKCSWLVRQRKGPTTSCFSVAARLAPRARATPGGLIFLDTQRSRRLIVQTGTRFRNA